MKDIITFTCPIHGDITQNAQSHIKSGGCPKCGDDKVGNKLRKNIKTFVDEANEVHNNFYDYSNVNYKNTETKVLITCPKHGDFNQTPHSYLQGQGCPNCGKRKLSLINKDKPTNWRYSDWEKAGKVSSNFDGFSLYVIECFSKTTGERFIKVGKTFVGVSKRFDSNEKMPYAYKILTQIYHNAYAISKLEKEIHKKLKEYSITVSRSFVGESECFDMKCADLAIGIAEGKL